MRLFICGGAALLAVALAAATASASTALTKAQYVAKLRQANTVSAKADDSAMAALQSKTSTAAQVKAKLFAMGKAHAAVGREFSKLKPPQAATKANADFAHAEILFGQENESIARKLPGTKAGIASYLAKLEQPEGGKLLDRAIAELHAAGFKI